MDGTLRGRGFELPRQRTPLIPNGVLGMMIFIGTEVMLFAGMISAYTIGRTSALTVWPPPNQPRLPIESTLVNTAALLASGVVLFYANRAFKREPSESKRLVLAALLLGGAFVVLQGYEWVSLIAEGLTLTTSTHGAFFYMIVGTHALHAVGAVAGLAFIYRRLLQGSLDHVSFVTMQAFWYFVVAMWPVLYWRVYLS